MSKISAGPSPGSSSLWQPSTASRASSAGSMMSSTMPVSSRTRSANSAPLSPGGRPRSRPSATARRCGASACRRRSRARRPRGPSRPRDSSPAARQALAEPDDARESVDDGEPALVRARDQQPAIVGAEIDRAIGMTMRLPLRRGALDPMARPAREILLQGRRTGDTLRHDTRPFLSFTARNGRLT